MSSALLPDTILTASSCLTDTLPDRWTLAWEDAPEAERRRLEAIWEVDRGRLETIRAWAEDAYVDGSLLWPNIFPFLDVARNFLDELGVEPDRAVILGIGLHPTQQSDFLRENILPEHEAQGGLVRMIRKGNPMPGGGLFLGWEILGFEYGGMGSHSWLCNGLEVVFNERFGIRPNERGLIQDWADAAKAASLCNDPGTGAEPVDWWAWAIVQYPFRPEDEV